MNSIQRVRVKVCGITCLEDALAALKAGADALGFVFYEKSTRHVSIEQAKLIIEQLPAFVTTTALFVNAESAFVEEAIDEAKFDLLQFHGDEAAGFCESFSRPYMKAIRMQKTTNLAEISRQYPTAKALLLDAYVKGVPGGTGETFNWDWIAPSKRQDVKQAIILAGGLHAENVAEAIEAVQPWAVDVSGGVEASPGKKSPERIQQFIQNVAQANLSR